MLKFKHLLSILVLAVSANVVASGVSMEMFQMKRQINLLTNAQTAEEFTQNADKFIEVSKKAQATMPNSLDGDQEKFKGYQQGMQEVIDVVAQAKNLASQGNLTEAKTVIARLDSLRKLYHSVYK
ncbi:cytochrome b562 [Glaesserella parasuis]|uniref:Soluble cytochrome b562 n=2 Tax=Glaesserella parasuis TaxID=738 RepID=B8F8E1_GLAP5|nr:cytochrome b562 [Glaesserella parasuis]ACL33593.1 soluble cytochrome b562 [Glaesserella parasuis SH0165]AIK17533.1 cytochrome B562 [Glaesserella parasuis]EMY46983.1 soluble cytochrome b562 [Glaesserella parasuis gx033]KDB46921.1 cytochrome B562 [Glaesserella parasuis HPS9]KDD78676.1 cytochrome B562 [Glaesserella parasuis ST4-1]